MYFSDIWRQEDNNTCKTNLGFYYNPTKIKIIKIYLLKRFFKINFCFVLKNVIFYDFDRRQY